jgi:hypothetical protein
MRTKMIFCAIAVSVLFFAAQSQATVSNIWLGQHSPTNTQRSSTEGQSVNGFFDNEQWPYSNQTYYQQNIPCTGCTTQIWAYATSNGKFYRQSGATYGPLDEYGGGGGTRLIAYRYCRNWGPYYIGYDDCFVQY